MQVLEVSQPGVLEPWCLRQPEAAQPGPSQVRLDIRAATIQPLSLTVNDVAGVVAQVGPGVEGLRPGDEVWAYLGRNTQVGYRESICVDRQFVAKKPVNLSFSEAAAIPSAGLLAYQSVYCKARVQPQHKVLITGASRGAGCLALQMCRNLGVDFILTTAGSQRSFSDLRQGLEEEFVIAYAGRTLSELQEEVTRRSQGQIDVALDFVGHRLLQLCFRSISFGGQLVTLVEDPWALQMLASSQLVTKSISLHPIYLSARAHFGGPSDWASYSQLLDQLTQLFESGQLVPPKFSDFGSISPDCLREAHCLGSQSDALGQLVVQFQETFDD